LAGGLAPARKLSAELRDKVALRDLAARVLPREIAERPKQPYRAPELAPFFGPAAPGWVGEALGSLELFDSAAAAPLLARARAGRATSPREAMAVLAILSTQLWYERLCRAPRPEPETRPARVRLDRTEHRSAA
jgi:asparagine synthase (glutamine-hydrolysing)